VLANSPRRHVYLGPTRVAVGPEQLVVLLRTRIVVVLFYCGCNMHTHIVVLLLLLQTHRRSIFLLQHAHLSRSIAATNTHRRYFCCSMHRHNRIIAGTRIVLYYG
jgi:hypothetical protein